MKHSLTTTQIPPTVHLGSNVADQKPVTLNFARLPHSLILGGTGRGKTTLAASILDQWVTAGGLAVVAEHTGVAYNKYKGARGVLTVTSSPQDVAYLLAATYHEMTVRYDALKTAGLHNQMDLPEGQRPSPILVLLDDVAELLAIEPARRNRTIAEENSWVVESRNHLGAIARLGRVAGIHLVLVTQRTEIADESSPVDGKVYYSLHQSLLNNLEGRILLGTVSEDARIVAGFPESSIVATPGIAGRGLFGCYWDQPVEVQFGRPTSAPTK